MPLFLAHTLTPDHHLSPPEPSHTTVVGTPRAVKAAGLACPSPLGQSTTQPRTPSAIPARGTECMLSSRVWAATTNHSCRCRRKRFALPCLGPSDSEHCDSRLCALLATHHATPPRPLRLFCPDAAPLPNPQSHVMPHSHDCHCHAGAKMQSQRRTAGFRRVLAATSEPSSIGCHETHASRRHAARDFVPHHALTTRNWKSQKQCVRCISASIAREYLISRPILLHIALSRPDIAREAPRVGRGTKGCLVAFWSPSRSLTAIIGPTPSHAALF